MKRIFSAYYKSNFFVITLIVLYLIYTLNSNSTANSVFALAPPSEENLKKIILIDPGHGGIDGGAVSKRGTLEKNINLSISLKLRDRLSEYGYTVLMTREEDKGLYTSLASIVKMKYEDLNNRCLLKRDSNCDVFISIHQNFFPQHKYYGAQVWYSNSFKSKVLAQIIQRNLRNNLKNDNKREEKPAGNSYKILRCYLDIPSVIVECGFLSNFREEIQLKNELYQQIIADTIAESIKEFFEYQDIL